jgi:hypothetical protein
MSIWEGRTVVVTLVLTLCVGSVMRGNTFGHRSNAAAGMVMEVGLDGVTVRNVPAGSRVVLFGVGREPRRYRSAIRDYMEVLSDEDRDGVVRLSSTPITNKSIWIAVNLDGGEFAVETGPGYPRREAPASAVTKRNDAGELSKFEFDRGVVELLVVRPGKGAWRLNAWKSSAVDENRDMPESMRLDASSFHVVEGVTSEAFQQSEPGDVIAMIDPRGMEFSVVTVGEEK